MAEEGSTLSEKVFQEKSMLSFNIHPDLDKFTSKELLKLTRKEVHFFESFYLISAIFPGIFESIISNPSAGIFCNQLDGLHHPIHNLVFYSGVFTLCVLSDSDNVHIIVQSFESLNGLARSHIGIKIEFFPQCQVQ